MYIYPFCYTHYIISINETLLQTFYFHIYESSVARYLPIYVHYSKRNMDPRKGQRYTLLLIKGWGGPERMGPRPPPWVPLLRNPIMVAVSFPPV